MSMSRLLRFIPEPKTLVEVTARTLQSCLLLRPSEELNEIVLGVLGRTPRLYEVGIIASVFLVARNRRDGLSHHLWYTPGAVGEAPDSKEPILCVRFYRTKAGNEPVRQWLKSLKREDRKAIGQDLKTAQYGWPLGMPLIKKLGPGLWEVRSHVTQGAARVLFTVDDSVMVLLHGFVKKSQKTPPEELRTARQRLADLQKE